MVENPHVRGGLTAAGVRWAFAEAYSANWHPLTWLSHMLDCQLFGLDAGGHHLTSVGLHAASALVLFAALHDLTGALWRSAFVAAVFALHPLRVESVAWVAERKDVLAALFWNLALWGYGRWARRPTAAGYALVLVAFTAGLLAKPMVVTLPFVLLLLDVWPLGRTARAAPARLLLEKVPLLLLAAAVSVVTVRVQRGAGAMPALASFPLGLRIENALVAYVAYLGKLVWPARLAVFYPHPAAFPPAVVGGAAALLVATTGLVLRAARARPYLAVGWLWYLGTLVPVLGILRAGEQAMADRFTYIPLVGIAVMLAWGVPDLLAGWRHRRAALATAGALVLAGCVAATALQLRVWRDSATLFRHALAVTTGNYVAHNNLGAVLVDQGRFPEALDHFTAALRLRPGYVVGHVNLGRTLAATGEPAAARAEYAEALRLDPASALAHYNLGHLLDAGGEVDEAIANYREAVRLRPDYAKAHNNLGLALAARGKLDEAIGHFREALRLAPDLAPVHNNLAIALEGVGRTEEAVAEYREVVRLAPGDPHGYLNLGAVLAGRGHVDEAVAHYRELLRRAPDVPEAHLALADALAQQGRIDEAIGAARAALRIRPGWPPAAERLAALLARADAPAASPP